MRNSPDIDTDKPVSRQHEHQYLAHHAYPLYWGSAGALESGTHPNLMMPEFVSTPSFIQPQADGAGAGADASAARHDSKDTHLRSCKVVMGYHIHASDGEIGHVQGMLVDEATWAIRYLVVNTSNWWIGHQVLITPELVREVSWSDRMVSLSVTRHKVKEAPPYETSFKVDRMHEVSIYKHYGNKAYWVKEQIPDAPRAAAPK